MSDDDNADDARFNLIVAEGRDVTVEKDGTFKVFPPGRTKPMTIAVFGRTPDGEMIEIGKPTVVHVPKGFEVLVRARSFDKATTTYMVPFEWSSERDWPRDVIMGPPKIGLWSDDE